MRVMMIDQLIATSGTDARLPMQQTAFPSSEHFLQ